MNRMSPAVEMDVVLGPKAPRPRQPRRLPLVELLIDTEAVLFDFAVRSGLQVLDATLEEDRTAICGPRYAHQAERTASRAGTVASTLNSLDGDLFGGQKQMRSAVRRLRTVGRPDRGRSTNPSRPSVR